MAGAVHPGLSGYRPLHADQLEAPENYLLISISCSIPIASTKSGGQLQYSRTHRPHGAGFTACKEN